MQAERGEFGAHDALNHVIKTCHGNRSVLYGLTQFAAKIPGAGQFLIEAAVLTAIGGAFGVLVGSALAASVAQLISFPVSLPVWSFVIGVGASAVIGIGFGLFPANRAANMDPIEALRYE